MEENVFESQSIFVGKSVETGLKNLDTFTWREAKKSEFDFEVIRTVKGKATKFMRVQYAHPTCSVPNFYEGKVYLVITNSEGKIASCGYTRIFQSNDKILEKISIILSSLTYEEYRYRKVVKSIVHTRFQPLRKCYLDLLKESPFWEGVVLASIEVQKQAAKGRVKSVSIREENSKQIPITFKGCVSTIIKNWEFPNPSDVNSVTIEYPMHFRK